MNYETLLQEASDTDVYVIEKAPFESDAKGLIKNDVIGLNQSLGTAAEKACVLAEELATITLLLAISLMLMILLTQNRNELPEYGPIIR